MKTSRYDNPVEPASVNMDADKLASIVERFRSQQASGSFPGGQLVLRRNGKLVLNVAIGSARGFRHGESIAPVQVQPQTPFPVFSAGKPLAAIIIAALEDRGLLDAEAPIAQVFPEFAQHGQRTDYHVGCLDPSFWNSDA